MNWNDDRWISRKAWRKRERESVTNPVKIIQKKNEKRIDAIVSLQWDSLCLAVEKLKKKFSQSFFYARSQFISIDIRTNAKFFICWFVHLNSTWKKMREILSCVRSSTWSITNLVYLFDPLTLFTFLSAHEDEIFVGCNKCQNLKIFFFF